MDEMCGVLQHLDTDMESDTVNEYVTIVKMDSHGQGATAVDIENMARDAFTRIDDIHNDAVNNGEQAPMDANNIEEDEQWNEENLENLVRESTRMCL